MKVVINKTEKVKMSIFKSVVFAGGGNRCFWQLGFWDTVSQGLGLKPDVVAGVSAGAAMAALVMSGTSDPGLRLLKEAIAANRKNFYFSNIFRKAPVFPHHMIYRNTLCGAIDDAALEKIKEGPDVRVMFAHPPLLLGAIMGTMIGLSAFLIEKHIKHPVHSVLASKIGYTPEVVRLNDCNRVEELVDLVMCSSCSPPFVPVHRNNGRVALDGGILDNVPVSVIGEDAAKGDILVLLPRRHAYKYIPRVRGRIYVQPSSDPAIAKFDFTDAVALQKTYDLGRRDGELFVKQYLVKHPPSP